MCLAVTYIRKKPRRNVGYKIVYPVGDRSLDFFKGLYSTGMFHYGAVVLNCATYTPDPVSSRGYIALTAGDGHYTTGFHIFTRLADARRVLRSLMAGNFSPFAVICKVAFLDVTAYGEVTWCFNMRGHYFTPTVVARQVKVLEEVK